MTASSSRRDPFNIAGITTIKATEITAPPGWALLERSLLSSMEEAVPRMISKYAERAGAMYFADDLDDLYERVCDWGLVYAIGGADVILDLALQEWNAATRFSDLSIVSRVHPRFHQQAYNEYYNLEVPGGAEWHHQGEGNQAFYNFGLADPTISENVRRAQRFAGMMIGEDPEADNWNPKHKMFRSPMQTSQGPYHNSSIEFAHRYLDTGNRSPLPDYSGRASLHPIVKNLEMDWDQNPRRVKEILKLFDKIILNGDVANSLSSTALVTNAYLYTGDEKYKHWVLEYVEAWMERSRLNGGIMPDNVGPSGVIGEQRDGQWWGGLYGWNSPWAGDLMFHALTIASECALLLTGDTSYLDLIRSQVEMLMNHSTTREDGQLLVPSQYGPEGWQEFRAGRLREPEHLYHASMSSTDYQLLTVLREGERERDWNAVVPSATKGDDNAEARFQYYDGKNPDWPEKILRAEHQVISMMTEAMNRDERDPETIIADNELPPQPVVSKGLTQVTMGAPQNVYHGGLNRATVRYFDQDRARAGLPLDVAALVDSLTPKGAGVQLINLSRRETRHLIVQAGAFGEHQFTEVSFDQQDQPELGRSPYKWMYEPYEKVPKRVKLDSKYLAVELPPNTSIRLNLGMRRYVNTPSYAFPWHGGKIPVPFQ